MINFNIQIKFHCVGFLLQKNRYESSVIFLIWDNKVLKKSHLNRCWVRKYTFILDESHQEKDLGIRHRECSKKERKRLFKSFNTIWYSKVIFEHNVKRKVHAENLFQVHMERTYLLIHEKEVFLGFWGDILYHKLGYSKQIIQPE